ncbi:MAG: CoA ester lyase [Pseudomonadales bacterium]
MHVHRLRRCCLSVPGSHDKMLAKAATLAVDQIVIDLEDAVAPDQKASAREKTLAALATPWQATSVTVRINGVNSPHCLRDVIALSESERPGGQAIASLILPKTQDIGHIDFVAKLMDQLEVDENPSAAQSIEALIEDAEGMINVNDIALASERVEALIFGMGDFAAAQGIQTTVIGDQSDYAADLWHYPRYRLIMAARAAGIAAVDGPYAAFRDLVGLTKDSRTARLLGMNGKWAIHPDQVACITEIFSPTQAQVDTARKQKAAFLAALATGQGAVAVDGAMVDQAAINLLEPLLAEAELLGM